MPFLPLFSYLCSSWFLDCFYYFHYISVLLFSSSHDQHWMKMIDKSNVLWCGRMFTAHCLQILEEQQYLKVYKIWLLRPQIRLPYWFWCWGGNEQQNHHSRSLPYSLQIEFEGSTPFDFGFSVKVWMDSGFSTQKKMVHPSLKYYLH